jgi:hypothetical protein
VSCADARVEWPEESTREGWLRGGYLLLAKTAAEVAARLAQGEGPGAFTPGVLFRPELVVEAGGEFVLDH